MKHLVLIFSLYASICSYAQSDSTRTTFKKVKPTNAFADKMFLVSPQIGFAKDTKNNIGLELEYGIGDVLGFVGSISRGTYSDELGAIVSNYGESTHFSGLSFGLRGHTARKAKSQVFDICPGVYLAIPFNKSDIVYAKPAAGIAIDFHLFPTEHVGLVLNFGKAIQKDSSIGVGFGLVLK